MQKPEWKVTARNEADSVPTTECVWCLVGLAHPPEFADSCCASPEEMMPDAGFSEPTALGLYPAADPVHLARAGEIARFGERDEFILRLAVTEEDRLKCWRLTHIEYMAQGYAKPGGLEYRYSIHDALPDTTTFLIEADGKPVGTVTVFPDSPLGLPADEIYRREIDGLRAAGRRPVEVGRLAISQEYAHERSILTNLFDILSICARRMHRADDLVITVNPSHAQFYRRMILFETAGEPRELDSVCGAPAVLLRLDLGREERSRRYAHGEGPKPADYPGGRTMYPRVSGRIEEESRVQRLRQFRRRPDGAFIRRYFVWLRPLIPGLSSGLRNFFETCYGDLGRGTWCTDRDDEGARASGLPAMKAGA